MILAYLWVADWMNAERVCRALRRHMLQYVRRLPNPWHAVRCLLPPKTPTNALSAWIRALHSEQDTVEAKWTLHKYKLAVRQRYVWNMLYDDTLVVYQWKHGEYETTNAFGDPSSRFVIKVDKVRTTTAELRNRIVQHSGQPLAPCGKVTGDLHSMTLHFHDAYFSFDRPGTLWSSHPTINSFAHLQVAVQSNNVADTIVYCTLSGGGQTYAVQISLHDTFSTLARYLAAVRGMPMRNTSYFVFQGRPMNAAWSLHGVGAKPNEPIHVHGEF